MKRNITGTKIRSLRAALRQIKPYAGFRLSMILIPIMRKLDQVVGDLDEARKPYDMAVEKIAHEYAKRDGAGNIIYLPDGRIPIDDISGYTVEVRALQEEWGADYTAVELAELSSYEIDIPEIHEEVLGDRVKEILNGNLMEELYDYLVFSSPADTP